MSESGVKLSVHSSYLEIHQRFANSEYGAVLADTLRYDRYRPNYVNPQQWRELLGADVNCLEHMQLTYGITRQFLHYHRKSDAPRVPVFDNQDQHVLLLAARVHDWQEAVVGDINYELKTDADEAIEQEIFDQLFDELFDVNDPRHGLTKAAVIETIFDTNSKLGQAFNAVERIGYLRTGLRAFEVRAGQETGLAQHLEWLSLSVLVNQIPPLLNYCDTYPYVHRYLSAREKQITTAFAELTTEVFIRHGQDDLERHEELAAVKAQWQTNGI